MGVSRTGIVLRLQDTILLTESVSSTISHISLDKKLLGERSAGNPHAAFDVAGAGNGRLSYRARSRPYLGGGGYHWAALIPDDIPTSLAVIIRAHLFSKKNELVIFYWVIMKKKDPKILFYIRKTLGFEV